MQKKYEKIPTLKPSIKIINIDSEKSIIYDEIKDVYYKTTKNIADILQLINGKNNINTINEEYRKQTRIVLTNTQLTNIIYNKIGQKFIIVGNETIDESSNKTDTYIKNQQIVFNAATINFISQKIKFLYSILFFIPFLAILGFCFYCIANTSTINKFSNNATLILYPILILFSTIAHEFGHAVACNYYNIKNKGIGVGLFMGFMPVAFADVSAIWLLKPHQRIVVNLGGIYFESIFLVIVYFVSVLLKIKILLPLYLLVYLKTLTNLIPFYRSDGYWIISDLFGVENLYSTSIDATKNILSNLKIATTKDFILSFYFVANILLVFNFIYYVLFVKGFFLLTHNAIQFFQNIIKYKQFDISIIGSVFILFMFIVFWYRILKFIVRQLNKKNATK